MPLAALLVPALWAYLSFWSGDFSTEISSQHTIKPCCSPSSNRVILLRFQSRSVSPAGWLLDYGFCSFLRKSICVVTCIWIYGRTIVPIDGVGLINFAPIWIVDRCVLFGTGVYGNSISIMEAFRLSKQYHFEFLSNRGLLRTYINLTGVGIVSGRTPFNLNDVEPSSFWRQLIFCRFGQCCLSVSSLKCPT